MLAGAAFKVLCIFMLVLAMCVQGRKFLLRFDVNSADFQDIQLITANAAVEYLFLPRGRIEPPAIVDVNKRDWQRPFFFTNYAGPGS